MLGSYKEKIKSSIYEYIPIVLGSNANALGIVRSLGENQLPVIVADHDNGVAFYSKYACPVKINDCVLDKDGFINSLHKIAAFLELFSTQSSNRASSFRPSRSTSLQK